MINIKYIEADLKELARSIYYANQCHLEGNEDGYRHYMVEALAIINMNNPEDCGLSKKVRIKK